MHIQIQWFAINQFRRGGDGLFLRQAGDVGLQNSACFSRKKKCRILSLLLKRKKKVQNAQPVQKPSIFSGRTFTISVTENLAPSDRAQKRLCSPAARPN
jgi:hypothetical protein